MISFYFVESGTTSSINWPAWIASSIALLVFVSNFYWNGRREWRNYRDSYWFEKIVAPHCIEPIIDFQDSVEKSLNSLGNTQNNNRPKSFRNFDADLAKRCKALTSKLWISKTFGNSCYDRTSELIDDLEDQMALIVGDAWKEKRSLKSHELTNLIETLRVTVISLLKEAKSIKVK